MEEVKDPTKTKFDARVIRSSNPHDLVGFYLSEPIAKTWNEDYLDDSTGEVVTIERNEILIPRGERVTPELASTINFYYCSGDITGEIEVSDQARLAYPQEGGSLLPFKVVANINGKDYRFILEAVNVETALAVASDWIQLNYKGGYTFKGVSQLNDVVLLNDSLLKLTEEGDVEQVGASPEQQQNGDRYYKAEADVRITYNEADREPEEISFTFIVKTTNVETSKAAAEAWIAKRVSQRRTATVKTIQVNLTSAVPFHCTTIINRAFCLAYKPQEANK